MKTDEAYLRQCDKGLRAFYRDNPHTMRMSPDSAWPLRTADGRTFAERKEQSK